MKKRRKLFEKKFGKNEKSDFFLFQKIAKLSAAKKLENSKIKKLN